MSYVEDKIIDIFSSVTLDDKNLLNKDTYIKDTEANSLNLVQVIIRIEQEFGIEIDDTDLNYSKIIQLEDLFNIVRKKL